MWQGIGKPDKVCHLLSNETLEIVSPKVRQIAVNRANRSPSNSRAGLPVSRPTRPESNRAIGTQDRFQRFTGSAMSRCRQKP